MRKLDRLWSGLERIPGLAAIPAFWRELCGPDFALIERFMLPTETQGTTHPCPHPKGGDCPRRIIDYGSGEYVAICRDPWKLCDDVPLEQKEVLIHRLDLAQFTKLLASPLGIRWQQPQERFPHVWSFGVLPGRSRLHLPVYLISTYSPLTFHNSLRDLLLASPNAFVVVAPTRNHLAVELHEELNSRRCVFLALEELIGLDELGQFVAIEPGANRDGFPTPLDQREQVVDAFKDKFAYTVDVICQDAQVHRSDFYKWLRGELADHLGKSKRIEDLLRSDPTVRTRR